MATAPFWITKPAFSELQQLRRLHDRQSAPAGLFSSPARETNIMTKKGFEAEALGVEEMDEIVDAWSDLVTRALEPNAFFEPAFALSAARHFPATSRPLFLAVWRRTPQQRRLAALLPIVSAGKSFGAGVARGWLHKQAALATPLVDAADARGAAAALLDWFAQCRPEAGAVLFPKIPARGPVFAALTQAAQTSGREWRTLDGHERAILLPGGDPQELWTRLSSRKALKELQRRQRRLEDFGPVRRRLFTAPEEVRAATEDFLALEAKGWKARRGALLGQPSLTTFLRSATRLLAREKKCRIHSLELAGRPIAMGIVIESAGRAYFWKVAYDESLRSQAPGVQLAYAVTEAQTARGDVDMTDSCAIANHPMIDRVWPDRLAICDLAIQCRPDNAPGFTEAFAKEGLRRRFRAMAKRTANRLLRRKEI